MKKIISIIIIIVSLVFQTAIAEEQVKDEKIHFDFLKKIGIVDFEFEDIENIDRKLFSYLLSRITDYKGGGDYTQGNIFDIDSTYRFNEEMVYTINMGYMKDNGYGLFYPDKEVSYNDAMLAFVELLGYGVQNLSYPSGYSLKGQSLGLVKNMKIGNADALSAEEIYEITYNFLHTFMLKQITFGSSTEFTSAGKETALEYFLLIKYTDGILDGVRQTSLSAPTELRKGYITINKALFSVADDSYNNYLGYKVRCYYKDNIDTKNERNVVAIFENKIYNIGFAISGSEIKDVEISSSKTVITYNDNKKEKKITLGQETDIIYNGKALPLYSKSDFSDINANIVFLDNNGDNKYDVVFITAYQTVFIDYLNIAEKFIADKYDNKNSLRLNNKDDIEYSIFNSGKQININELKEEDVLSVAVSKDGKYYTIICTREFSEGEITGLETDDNLEKVTVDGILYEINPQLPEKLKLGTEGKFFFDCLGRISAVELTEDTNKYGYLIGVKISNDIDSAVSFKILTPENEILVLKAKEKLQFNTVNTPAKSAALNSLISINSGDKITDTVRQIITYTTNSKEEIKAINTANAVTDEDSLRTEYTKTDAYYTTYNYSFDSRCFLDDDTIVFRIPNTGDPKDEDAYTAGKITMFTAFQRYNVIAYNYDEYDVAKAVVLKSDSNKQVTYDTPFFLVTRKSTKLSDTLEPLMYLSGVQNKMQVQFPVSNEEIVKNYKAGDILRIALNKNNEISYVEPVLQNYSYSNINNKFGMTDEINGEYVAVIGRVIKSNGQRVVLDTSKLSGIEERSVWNLSNSAISVYKYYVGSNTAEAAVAGDICHEDIIVLRSRSGRVWDVIIIKE